MSETLSADWCAEAGALVICGTRMKEHSRDSQGERWCFSCRKRHEFWWVVMVPDGFSWYGPGARMKGIQRECSDLFPGWERGPIEE